MTDNKEAAYYAAVRAAFKTTGKPTDDPTKYFPGDPAKLSAYESVLYDPLDAYFLECVAAVRQALNDLPHSKPVDANTFAFMLGIGASQLRNIEGKPAPCRGTNKGAKKEWTVGDIKAFREARKALKETAKDAQSTRAVRKGEAKERATMEARQDEKNLVERIRQIVGEDKGNKGVRVPADVLLVMVNMLVRHNRHILGFVDLHALSRDEISAAIRDGARVERMSIRQALLERTWVNPLALQPWLEGYEHMLDAAVNEERALVGAAYTRASEIRFREDIPFPK